MSNMMIESLRTLGQIAPNKLQSDMPRVDPGSTAVTWMVIGVLFVAILLMAFKQAKRNTNVLED